MDFKETDVSEVIERVIDYEYKKLKQMEKLLRVAEMRDLEKQVSLEEISYSRMVEIINEKHFMQLVNLRGESETGRKQMLMEFYEYIKKNADLKNAHGKGYAEMWTDKFLKRA